MTELSLLIVEDHDDLREVTQAFLSGLGHQVRAAPDAETFDELMAQAPADIVILDVNLPGEDGHSVCQRLRRARPSLGIIMLTGRASVLDRVTGYERGADVYLAKPTSNEELAAAVHSLGRRVRRGPEDARVQLHESRQMLNGPGGEVPISESEVVLLRALAQAPGWQLAYWQAMEVLDMADGPDAKGALEVRVVRLRKKLLQAGAAEPALQAVRLVGYRLTEQVAVV